MGLDEGKRRGRDPTSGPVTMVNDGLPKVDRKKAEKTEVGSGVAQAITTQPATVGPELKAVYEREPGAGLEG